MRFVTSLACSVVLAGCAAPAVPEFSMLEHPAAAASGALGADMVVLPGGEELLTTWVAPIDGRLAIHFSRSTDGGATWSPAVLVSQPDDSVYAQEESTPVLAVSPSGIAVAYGNIVPSTGTPWSLANVKVARSTDGGASWLPGVTVNDDTTGAQAGHQFQGVTGVGDAGLVAAWLDTRPDPEAQAGAHGEGGHSGTAQLYWVRSDDFGASWSRNFRGGERMCDCCRVSLGSTRDGRPLATWRQAFPGDRRETVVAPLDTVAGVPTPVHVDDWEFAGCPDAGPESAVDSSGIVHVTWYTGAPGRSGIWYARSRTTDVADGFAEPIAIDTASKAPISRVAIAIGESGRVAVVYDRRPDFSSGLFLGVIEPDQGVTRRTLHEGNVRRPEVAVLADGAFVLSWTEDVGATTQARFARFGDRR